MIKDFTIQLSNASNASVLWTSDNTTDVSWLFVDGQLVRGPLYLETLDRQIDINFIGVANKAIEVHDFTSGSIVPDANEIRPNTRPLIKWMTITGAVRFRVYHTPFGGTESLIYDEPADDSKTAYEITSPIKLTEGWNQFRVESVDEFGNESTRDIWVYQVFDIDSTVNDLTITDGSGANLFDITIS